MKKNISRAGSLVVVIFCIATCLTIYSCSTPPDDDQFDDVDLEPFEEVTYDVTYKDDTTIISEETISENLKSVSEDGRTFRFDTAADEIARLNPGDVVIFSGVSLKKVKSVNTEGGEFIVETESAQLNDAIRDGTISWERNVDFATEADILLEPGADASFVFRKRDSAIAGYGANRAIEFSGTISGWEISMELDPQSSKLNMSFTAAYKAGGTTVATVTGNGFVSDFATSGYINISEGVTTNVNLNNAGVIGEMEVKWSAFNDGTFSLVDIATISVPVIMPIPVALGPIPLLINLKVAARIVPELRFAGSSSIGSFKVNYNSETGFSVANGSPSAQGELNSGNVAISGDTVSAGNFATALGFGVEFPRLEIAPPGELVSAFITLDTYAYSLYDPMVPCQEGYSNVKAIAGYGVSLFGIIGLSGQTEIWKKELLVGLDDKTCP